MVDARCPRCQRTLDVARVCVRCACPDMYISLRWFEEGGGRASPTAYAGTGVRKGHGANPTDTDVVIPRRRRRILPPLDPPWTWLATTGVGQLHRSILEAAIDDLDTLVDVPPELFTEWMSDRLQETCDWFLSDSSEICSFEACCFLLGLEADAIRGALKVCEAQMLCRIKKPKPLSRAAMEKKARRAQYRIQKGHVPRAPVVRVMDHQWAKRLKRAAQQVEERV